MRHLSESSRKPSLPLNRSKKNLHKIHPETTVHPSFNPTDRSSAIKTLRALLQQAITTYQTFTLDNLAQMQSKLAYILSLLGTLQNP